MCKKNYVVLLLLPLCLVLCGETKFGETKLKIVNNTNEAFKIKTTRSTYLCGPGGCPSSPRVTEKDAFLGFFPHNPKPVTFDWIPRSLDWNRDEYAIFTSERQRIDLLVETGATWTFAVAKKGGSWGTDNNKNLNLVTGTDLWIKAGANGLIVDTEKRDHESIMQVSPRLYCRIECFITPLLYPDYQLTFTDNASPEVWLQRSLVHGQTNVVFKNSTPIDWTIKSTGFYDPDVTVDSRKSTEFEKNSVEKLFSFGPSLPRPNVTKRDGSVYFTFTPKQTSVNFKGDQLKFEPFVVALYQVGKDQIPQVKMGRSRYRLTKNLSIGGVMLEFTQSPEQWRFNVTLSPGILKPVKVLRDELAAAMYRQQMGLLSLDELNRKTAEVKSRALSIVETLPMPINITTLENFIINSATAESENGLKDQKILDAKLSAAIEKGDMDRAKILMLQGALAGSDKLGKAMTTACAHGDLETVRFLITRGAIVKSEYLAPATASGNQELIQFIKQEQINQKKKEDAENLVQQIRRNMKKVL